MKFAKALVVAIILTLCHASPRPVTRAFAPVSPPCSRVTFNSATNIPTTRAFGSITFSSVTIQQGAPGRYRVTNWKAFATALNPFPGTQYTPQNSFMDVLFFNIRGRQTVRLTISSRFGRPRIVRWEGIVRLSAGAKTSSSVRIEDVALFEFTNVDETLLPGAPGVVNPRLIALRSARVQQNNVCFNLASRR